jgi:hypothetical protein
MPTRLPLDLTGARAPNRRTAHALAARPLRAPWCSCRSRPAPRIGAHCRTARCCAACTHARYARPAIAFIAGRSAGADLLIVACWPRTPAPSNACRRRGSSRAAPWTAIPQSLLLWQQGCSASAANATLNATVAALEAAAFRFASFKSKPKKRERLTRIDIAAARKLPDLDLTLATAAGNNLARWLTALPPNTLDARGYRRCCRSCAAPEAGLQILRRDRTQAPGRGGVSRGVAAATARAMPASCTSGVPAGRHAGRRSPGRAGAPISLVGKGICFDTGGTNLKPHKSMLDMHTDMEGSAVAVGSLYALHACARPLPWIAGWRSPRIASVRSPTSRRMWCAPTTARPFR